MNEPKGIIQTAVYDSSQVCGVLKIGKSKLEHLVASGELRPLAYSHYARFYGQHLIEFCLRESEEKP